MTNSEHYTWATVSKLTGETDFGELDVEGGRIALDTSRWPFASASISTPSKPGLYAHLDPRTNARRVTLSCGEQVSGLARTFNLAVREVQAGADGLLEVQLASDEALLEDVAPTAEVRPWDALNYTYGYTAGGVARMVLADIGATVANPSPNPSLLPYWELTNKVTNPRFQSTTKGAATLAGSSNLISNSHTASGSSSRRALQWNCSIGGGEVVVAGYNPSDSKLTALPVKGSQSFFTPSPEDQWLSISVDVSAVAPNRQQYLAIAFHGSLGAGATIAYSPIKTAPDTRWVTHVWVGRPTPGAEYVSIRVIGGSIASSADTRMFASNVQLVEWDDTVAPFHGATSAGNGYTYSWDGDPDDSTSTRYPVFERDPNSLVRDAGQGGMSYLEPLLQSVGLRLVCDENRVWTLRHRDRVEAGGPVTLQHGVNLTEYSIEATLEDWCDAATVHYEWERTGKKYSRDDNYSSVTTPRKRTWLKVESPYPGAGRAENIVKRAQKAVSGSGTAVSNWAAKPEQAVTIVTPEATISGSIGSVEFDLDADEMTVEIRRD